MKGGKTPVKKTEKKVEKPQEKPVEKPVEKQEEKKTELVEEKKPTEEPKVDEQTDEKPNEDTGEPTEAPPEVPKEAQEEQETQKDEEEGKAAPPSEDAPSEEASTEIQPKQDTETIINHVVQTFKNSEDIGEALERLATEIPVAVLLNFFDKFLAIIEGVLAKVQEKLGVDAELKDPEKAMAEIKENLPKIKFRILLTGVIFKEIAQDPEILETWTAFIDIFQNKYMQPFLIAVLATLQEFEPQIEEQGDRVAAIMSKIVNRTGDAVSDAFGNVIAGIPYIGTVVAGIGSADNLAKIIIANINGWGELFLETSYRLSVTLKKVAPNGLMALDGTIDMVLNAYNTYLAVKNTLDRFNAVAQGIKFNPDEGYNADKLTDMIMNSAESAGTLPNQTGEPSAPPLENPVNETSELPEAQPAPEGTVGEAVPIASAEPVVNQKKQKKKKN